MLRKFSVQLFVTILLLVCGCVSVVDYDVPFMQQLVVHGFLRPTQPNILNDSIFVSVGVNTPVVGKEASSNIEQAIVTLKGENRSAELKLLSRSAADSANRVRRFGIRYDELLINPGENYKVSVTTPNGLSAVGICQIPLKKVEEKDITITIIEKSKKKIRCRIDWKSLPEGNTRYLCAVNIALSNGKQQSSWSSYVYRTDDESINGQLTTNELIFTDFEFEPSQSIIYVAVATIDQNYYDWGRKQILQRRQNNFNLFPEPVFLNGNIENNLGILAGYNTVLIAKNL